MWLGVTVPRALLIIELLPLDLLLPASSRVGPWIVPAARLPVDPSGRVLLLRTVVVDWLRDDVLTAAPRLCLVLPRVSRDVSWRAAAVRLEFAGDC